MNNILRALWRATLTLGLCASTLSAAAQDFPSRPLRLVVPYAAGGPLDLVARLYAQQLQEALSQTVLVDNRPGGSALIGIRSVLQAPADGYTLLMSTTTLTTNTIVFKEPGYKAEDFLTVAALGVSGLLLMQSTTLPSKTYPELMAYLKAHPKEANMGTLGGGGITQMLTSRFQTVTGVQVTEVPYKGAAPAMNDLLAGSLGLYIDALPTAIPHLASGRVRALAATTETRSPQIPDVPTFKELGVPEMVGGAWFAVHVSSKTPKAIVDKLRQQGMAMMRSKPFLDKLVAVKVDPWQGTLDSFTDFLKQDKTLWEADAQRSGLTGTL